MHNIMRKIVVEILITSNKNILTMQNGRDLELVHLSKKYGNKI